MSIWDNIIEYYETMSTHPRDGQMGDEIRYHCQETLRLIPDIRKHPKLQALEPQIAVLQLRLINIHNSRIAQILNNSDGSSEITLFHIGEGVNWEKHTHVQTETKNIIQVLSTRLFDSSSEE